jgi:hypothetical protein
MAQRWGLFPANAARFSSGDIPASVSTASIAGTPPVTICALSRWVGSGRSPSATLQTPANGIRENASIRGGGELGAQRAHGPQFADGAWAFEPPAFSVELLSYHRTTLLR